MKYNHLTNKMKVRITMVKIRRNLVPLHMIPKISYGFGNKKLAICIHETDNTRTGADADAHSRLQKNGNSRQASWHWTVDDVEAVQSFEHDVRCWASGTNGNNEAIHIEICVNEDGDYQKALRNASELCAIILKQEKTVTKIVQHNAYTGKNCPRLIRSGKSSWDNFLQMVKQAKGTPDTVVVPMDNNRYRLYTGTYQSKEQAEIVIDVMKHRFGWICYLEKINHNYRVKTGTFKGKNVAEQASNKIKNAKLALIVHIERE